jgi:predicted nucleic acid-binding protein
MFEKFFKEVNEFLKQKNYVIKDESLLKSLIHTFYFVSLQEYQNILKKIESD